MEKEKTHKHNGSTDEEEPQVTNYRGIKAMPFVIGNEIFEKVGTSGALINQLLYLTTVFNMRSIKATTLVNVFHGTTNIATVIGAFLSDTYFGRYNTLAFACIASFLGMLLFALTAAISGLHPPTCKAEGTGDCRGPTALQMTVLVSAFMFLVVGGGGIRPCNLAFGADQFNPKTQSGKRGIASFFNWYFFTYTSAMIVSLTIIVYVQSNVSWSWGLAIPAILMFFSCLLFFAGERIYVKVKPEGSPLLSVMQVIVTAVRKRHMKVSHEAQLLFNHIPKGSINSQLSHSDQFSCLDKGAIQTQEDEINQDGSAANPWKLCSVQKVEEMKCLIRVAPIWASEIVYFVAMVQQQTYVLFQAIQSDRRLGNTSFHIPPASYTIFTYIGLTIWLPVYDRLLVPVLRRITKKPEGVTVLQKTGTGMVLAVFTMLLSAIVEVKRRELAMKNPIGTDPKTGAISSLSGLWLLPQLTLIGLSEAFTIVGFIEFYYKEFPENMRSFAGAANAVATALSSYLSTFLISIVHKFSEGHGDEDWLNQDLNKGNLDNFYYLVAALGAFNFGYFVLCAKWYKYKESSTDTSSHQLASSKDSTNV